MAASARLGFINAVPASGRMSKWEAIDYGSRADQLDIPILIFHGTEDQSVPIETSRDLAEARPDLVTLVEFEGAEHVGSWNVDQERYEEELELFLKGL